MNPTGWNKNLERRKLTYCKRNKCFTIVIVDPKDVAISFSKDSV
jgi:hypothetical protein